jgi:hypothetical protein
MNLKHKVIVKINIVNFNSAIDFSGIHIGKYEGFFKQKVDS